MQVVRSRIISHGRRIYLDAKFMIRRWMSAAEWSKETLAENYPYLSPALAEMHASAALSRGCSRLCIDVKNILHLGGRVYFAKLQSISRAAIKATCWTQASAKCGNQNGKAERYLAT